MRIAQPEMQRCEAAHRAADDVRLANLEMAQDAGDIVRRDRLRVLRAGFRHLRGRVAARVVRDAAVAAAEVTDLRLPATRITSYNVCYTKLLRLP